ncbi:MFS transporter [Actinoplanes sp. NPDC051851]|uniref:MFS transporter n=1 Tax=Actinoplanes sp. NPDC051851 TaxID=3154753 RepID=UPI0034493580
MTRKRFIGFLVTIFATTYVVFSAMVVIPVIGNFYELFGDNLLMVNYIVSGGLLIAIIANLVGARLMRRVSKRTLLIVGTAVFTVSSSLQVAVLDVAWIAVMATLTGVGCGLVVVAAPALLSEAYPDEKKRGTMLGWYNAAGAAVGAALSAVAGVIAAGSGSWTAVYRLYPISALVLVLAIVFVPRTPTGRELHEASEAVTVRERVPFLPMAGLGAAGFVLSLVYMVPVYLIALLVAEKGLGDESVSGLLSSATTLGSALGCAAFGLIYRRIGRAAATVAFAVMAVSVALLEVTNVGAVAAGCFLLGVAYGIGFVYYTVRATAIVHPSRVPDALAVSWAAINLGGFASTYAVSAAQNGLGIATVGGVLPLLLGLVLVATVLSIGFGVRALTIKKAANR